jgi:hypothetical protein
MPLMGRWEKVCYIVFLSVSGCQVIDNGLLSSALLVWLPENIICSLAVFGVR